MAILRRKDKAGKLVGYQVLMDRRDPVTGARNRVVVGTVRTRKEADQLQREAHARRDRGAFVDPAKITTGEVLGIWLDSRKPNLTDNSYAEYEGAVRLHLRPALGHVLVQRLQYTHIQRQVNEWAAKDMGARLIHRNISVLKQALQQAVRGKLIYTNPAEGIEKPSVTKKRTLHVWDAAQVVAFLDASELDQFSPLWHFLVLEGMRRGEALGLRWSDINWHGKSVSAHIQQTVIPDVQNKGRALIQPRTKTQAGARSISLTASTVQALKDHRDRQRIATRAAGNAWDEHGLIFTTSVGTPITPSSIKRNQQAIMKRAEVPALTTHALRHTAATQMLLAGVPVVIVSQKLGHATVSITLDLYAHVLPADHQQANDALEAMLVRGRTQQEVTRAAESS